MGWRGTIALAVALVVAAVYAYVDLGSPGELSMEALLAPSHPTPPGEGRRPLLDFKPADIVAVDIRQGDADVALRRSGNSWAGIARPDVIDDFLINLLDLSRILVLDVRPPDLADHGLDPPSGTITLQQRGGPPLSIKIGGHNPPATGVYVQVDAEPEVILTGALILWEVEKAVKAAAEPHSNDG
jgi:Domain of unknown function (DUF4340)